VNTVPPPLAALGTEAKSRWRSLQVRERIAVSVAIAVVVVWLFWLVAIGPAWRTLSEAPTRIAELDGQLQTMQRLAAESRELRGTSPVPVGQSVMALTSATERLGPAGKITIQGDRATLTLNGVSTERLRAWLGEARSGARARPVDVQLTRGPQGYAGTIIVMLAGAQ
jgi:general secretion pathway protein M